MPDLVLTDIDPELGAATLTLNRPRAHNPTSIALLDAMDDGLDVITANESVRVVIIAGAGDSFCSGLDLQEVRGGAETVRKLLLRLSEVMRRVRRLPCATIACVQGAAIGGGFGLLAATDFAITHPESSIGYPPVRLGLSPALMAPWLMRKIGPSRARSLLMAGGTLSGEAAFEAGIVTHLVALEKLTATTHDLTRELATCGPFAMTAMKNFLNELDDSVSDAMLDRAAEVSAEVIACAETQLRLRDALQ